LDQLQRFLSGNSSAQSSLKSNSGLPPVDELIPRLAARLQKNPRDISGWRTLGWANFNIQHYDDAAAAYAKAIELYPNVADLYSARGEALVRAVNGTVTAESKQAFSEALRLDSKDLRARFFIGLAKAQAGDKTTALDTWIEVANDAGANEPTIPTLQQHIAELAKELKIDVNKRLHRPINAAMETPSSQTKGRDVGVAPGSISQSEAKPDASHPSVNPADQGDMIGGMVEGLTSRLSRSPRDVDGWLLLIRSRQVLNDPTAARETFERALKVFEESSPERDRRSEEHTSELQSLS
jgi:cytochrome c-type biogenesis protein CcmH